MNKKQAKFERLSYCEVYSKDKYATFRSKKQQTQLHQYSPAPVEINIIFIIDCFYWTTRINMNSFKNWGSFHPQMQLKLQKVWNN